MALVVPETTTAPPQAPFVAEGARPAVPSREAKVIRRRLVEQVLRESAALHAAQVRLQPMLDACSLDSPWPADVAAAFERLDETLTRLAAASEALDRLDAGVFGCCVRCGQAMPTLRLLADPASACCAACA